VCPSFAAEIMFCTCRNAYVAGFVSLGTCTPCLPVLTQHTLPCSASFTQWPQITELSRELDLDRTEVLNWVKEFSLKPERLVARHLKPHWVVR
jgi:hypothetical protein